MSLRHPLDPADRRTEVPEDFWRRTPGWQPLSGPAAQEDVGLVSTAAAILPLLFAASVTPTMFLAALLTRYDVPWGATEYLGACVGIGVWVSGLMVQRAYRSCSRFSGARVERVVLLAGRLFPKELRERAWEPAMNEEIGTYLEDRRRFRGYRWARRWLAFCFWLKFVLNFALTCRVWFLDSLEKLVPEKWRAWR